MSNRIKLLTNLVSVTLQQLVREDAEPLFNLFEANRERLSQKDDNVAGRYPDLEVVLQSITHPQNPAILQFGIWGGAEFAGAASLNPLSEKKAEIGYWVGRQHGGRGYATATASALVRYAFDELHVQRVTAYVRFDNIASQIVLTRAGFLIDRSATPVCFHFEATIAA